MNTDKWLTLVNDLLLAYSIILSTQNALLVKQIIDEKKTLMRVMLVFSHSNTLKHTSTSGAQIQHKTMTFHPKCFDKSISVHSVFENWMERGDDWAMDRFEADRKWCHTAAGGLLLEVVVADTLSADDTLHEKERSFTSAFGNLEDI